MSEALSKIAVVAGSANADSAPATTAWYAVQTLYRHEQRISRDLSAKGFSTYLPLLREMHQWSDRRKVLDIPAFSGYVFVRQDDSNRSRVRVLETSGVVRILGSGRTPTPIPDVEIESLRRALESGSTCEKYEHLPVGSMIEIRQGPLSGVRGRLLRISNGLRLVVSVSGVSQAISVEVDREAATLAAMGAMTHPRKASQPEAIRVPA